MGPSGALEVVKSYLGPKLVGPKAFPAFLIYISFASSSTYKATMVTRIMVMMVVEKLMMMVLMVMMITVTSQGRKEGEGRRPEVTSVTVNLSD